MTQNDEKKLLPCPFCGSEAEGERTDLMSRVICPTCHANIWSGEFDGLDAALAWNTRAPESAAVIDPTPEIAAAAERLAEKFAHPFNFGNCEISKAKRMGAELIAKALQDERDKSWDDCVNHLDCDCSREHHAKGCGASTCPRYSANKLRSLKSKPAGE